MDRKPEFTYWKYPWQKWLLAAAVGLEALVLLQLLSDFRDLTAVGGRIFSPEVLAQTLADEKMKITLTCMMLAACIWALLAGAVVHRKQSARHSELLLLLVLNAAYGIALIRIRPLPDPEWFPIFTLAVLAGALLWSAVLWFRSRKEAA